MPTATYKRVAKETGGALKEMARVLGVSYSSMYYELEKRGLKAEIGAIRNEPDPLDSKGRKQLNLEAELKRLKGENKRLKKNLLEQENLVDRIVSLTSSPLDAPTYQAPKVDGDMPVRDAVLPLFDLQFGQDVRRSETPAGMNEFNEEVFLERLGRFVAKVKDVMENYSQAHYIENLWIPLGGDMVEGDILKGHAWQLEFDPVEAVLRLREHLKVALDEIFHFAKDELGTKGAGCVCVTGNHGRVKSKKEVAPYSLNWDYLLYRLLRDDFNNYGLDVFAIEPGGEVYFESRGWVFRMIHGDEVKGHLSIPYYGLHRHDSKALRLHNTIFHYLLLGHHHQPANISIGDGEHLMSGNWVGATSFSRQIVAGGRPSQWLYFVSSKHGVGDRSLIHLDDPAERSAPEIHTLAS